MTEPLPLGVYLHRRNKGGSCRYRAEISRVGVGKFRSPLFATVTEAAAWRDRNAKLVTPLTRTGVVAELVAACVRMQAALPPEVAAIVEKLRLLS